MNTHNRTETAMTNDDDQQRNSVRENVIHVGSGFLAKEHAHVADMLSALRQHLGRWDPKNVVLDVSLQDRDGKEQRVTLRTTLPGRPPLIAVAENTDIDHALSEAKRELIRQLEHQKSGNEPMKDRRLRRATIRHPGASVPPHSSETAT